MKMTKQDFDDLSRRLDAAVAHYTAESIRQHRRLRLGKDIQKRFCWDMLWLLYKLRHNITFVDDLYLSYNNQHIYTALRRYVAHNRNLDV